MVETKSFEVHEKKSADITIPFADGKITYEYPSKHENSYFAAEHRLIPRQMRLPSAAENVAILYHALKNKGDEFMDLVAKKYRLNPIFSSTIAYYVPNRGVYFEDHPITANDGSFPFQNESSLQKRLEDGDKDVRFFQFGSQPRGLVISKKPSVIALCGNEAAEQLEEIARNENADFKAFIMGNAPFNKPTSRPTELKFSEFIGKKNLILYANGLDGQGQRAYFGVHRALSF